MIRTPFLNQTQQMMTLITTAENECLDMPQIQFVPLWSARIGQRKGTGPT
jgi:hypothetical protein